MPSISQLPEISIVIPVFNEAGNIHTLFEQLEDVLAGLSYEVVFVDDGSSDTSLGLIKELSATHEHVEYLSFSRNFGHQPALRAGLSKARGAAVISMDGDLQHPPKLIPDLIKKWRDGYDIVFTIRRSSKETGLFKRVTSSMYYKALNKMTDFQVQEGVADFRLLDRKIVDLINNEKEGSLFLRAYIDWLGFNRIGVEYVPARRHSGYSKYSLKRMFELAINGIMQFSTKPLRLAFFLASLAFLASALYVAYAVWASVFVDKAVPGWPSLVTLIVFMQGVQFFLIGLVGEYVGRTFMQTKDRPEYIIAEASYDRTLKKDNS